MSNSINWRRFHHLQEVVEQMEREDRYREICQWCREGIEVRETIIGWSHEIAHIHWTTDHAAMFSQASMPCYADRQRRADTYGPALDPHVTFGYLLR